MLQFRPFEGVDCQRVWNTRPPMVRSSSPDCEFGGACANRELRGISPLGISRRMRRAAHRIVIDFGLPQVHLSAIDGAECMCKPNESLAGIELIASAPQRKQNAQQVTGFRPG